MAEKEYDPAQAAAEKLDKETKKVQEEQARQFNIPRKNMPSEPDMGPLPAKKEPAKKFKKGGTASARADGCCIRGKTRA